MFVYSAGNYCFLYQGGTDMYDSYPPALKQSTRKSMSRRAVLHRLAGAVIAGSALSWLESCSSGSPTASPTPTPLATLYPDLTGQFGAMLTVGKKSDFPATRIAKLQIGVAGVFYHPLAKTYIVHLDKTTEWLLFGTTLQKKFAEEMIVVDSDGSYWVALYQRCVHLGCTVTFRDDCVSFKCPCHGAHFNCDGEYLDGPAPRSMDRFPLSFDGENVVVDTGHVNNRVPHPDAATRLIPVLAYPCV
jgi:cytochrome b6-f complex iron-sulfur subunit